MLNENRLKWFYRVQAWCDLTTPLTLLTLVLLIIELTWFKIALIDQVMLWLCLTCIAGAGVVNGLYYFLKGR